MLETFNVGVTPSGLAISGKYAYVANSNNFGTQTANGPADSVTVLNLHRGVPKTTIYDPSFSEPYRIAISDNGNVYVTNSGSPKTSSDSGTISVIDPKTNKVFKTISGFDGPSGIVISGDVAYVTNYGAPGGVQSGNGTTVSVVDLINDVITMTITVGLAPVAVALSPCGGFLYVINYTTGEPDSGEFVVVDRQTNKVIKTLKGLFGPFALVIADDKAYVSNFGSNDFSPYGTTVSVIDLKCFGIIKTIEVGIQPSGLAISLCRKYLYVSNYNALYAHSGFKDLTYGEGTINIIRLEDYKVISPTIPIGQTPSLLVLSDDGKKLYATHYSLNIVNTVKINFAD